MSKPTNGWYYWIKVQAVPSPMWKVSIYEADGDCFAVVGGETVERDDVLEVGRSSGRPYSACEKTS